MSVGLHIMTPTSIVVAGSGSTAAIRADGGVDFALATSLSLNGVFTSAYDDYMIVMRHVSAANNAINGRFRVAGVDASGSDYVFQSLDASATTVAAQRNTSQTQFRFANSDLDNRCGTVNMFYGPALAQPTAMRNVSARGVSGAQITDFASTHSLSIGYDGISIIPNSSNITGMVTVYGYAQ